MTKLTATSGAALALILGSGLLGALVSRRPGRRSYILHAAAAPTPGSPPHRHP
jgi:hypothetical protein